MRNICLAERGRLLSVVWELLNLKVNAKLSCVDFVRESSVIKMLLGKVLFSEKYKVRKEESDEKNGEFAGPSTSSI